MSMAQVKTGLVSVTFRQKSVEEIAALTAEAGLSGVEWGGDVHVPPGDREAARRAAQQKDGAQDHQTKALAGTEADRFAQPFSHSAHPSARVCPARGKQNQNG